MKLLLDTHVMLWWMEGNTRITAEMEALIAGAETVYFSRASLWEMAIKQSLGRLQLDLAVFCRAVEEEGFRWLEIRQTHLLTVAALPLFDEHRDPFDRLLVAQSLSEPLILLTADKVMARYGGPLQLV